MAERPTQAKPIEAFVCGHPIAHSRSPMIHGHWLKAYGLNGSYRAIDIAPSDFTDFMARLPKSGLAGGNVTIPHKETAFRLVAAHDEAAELTGAVNMLWLEDGEVQGGNTDVQGFAGNLDQFAPAWRKSSRVVVVGAGGAARAVLLALRRVGIADIRLANRSPQRAIELKDRFGGEISTFGLEALPEILVDADLLVNTTSLGMHGDSELPADPRFLPRHAVVADIVYVPLRTPLLLAAEQCGLKTVDGLGMLLHQAAPAFARWFGVLPDVSAELRDLVVADIPGKDVIILGLTGSIGMGKSTTARLFAEAGVPVHDSDETVHRLYAGGAAPLVEQAFPGTVVDGAVDRAKLAQHVVGDPQAIVRLEKIVHPLVRADADAFLARHRAANAPLVVLDIPLLFETGGTGRVDKIAVVTAPAEMQRERVLSRPGMTPEKFDAILARQTPDLEKRRRADFVIDTGHGLEAARAEVRSIIRELTGKPAERPL